MLLGRLLLLLYWVVVVPVLLEVGLHTQPNQKEILGPLLKFCFSLQQKKTLTSVDASESTEEVLFLLGEWGLQICYRGRGVPGPPPASTVVYLVE